MELSKHIGTISSDTPKSKILLYNIHYDPPPPLGVWTKCQPDKMPTGQNANLGWHFVRDFFSMVGILSGPTFWLAFCPDHLKMSWHPPPMSESGGPVTSFCLLLTVVGKKVDNFFLSGWLGKNTAVFYHHHLRCITPTSLTFCR